MWRLKLGIAVIAVMLLPVASGIRAQGPYTIAYASFGPPQLRGSARW